MFNKNTVTSLITRTPEEGYELAITLSKKVPGYFISEKSYDVIAKIIAINFQTVAAANNYWR